MIDPLFQVHMLNNAGKNRAVELVALFNEFLLNLKAICGEDGREVAIVKTKLEEASFFAKKAVANRSENQA